MANREHISLIIPAYNEAGRIGGVIEAAQGSPYLDDIIVVDDGSTDGTKNIADSYGVDVLVNPSNFGKGESMQIGFELAKDIGTTSLLFLDADLRGLKTEHIDALVAPIITNESSMTIGILDRTPFQKLILRHWGALSGQRAMRIEKWGSVPERFRTGFKAEAALNATARHDGWHRGIHRIELSGVTHVGKREKEPTLPKAFAAYARTYGAAALTYLEMELT